MNAVLAGKAAYAAHCGIVLESNVELGAVRLKTIEFCAILNDMLTHAIDCAEHSGAEEPRVRITALPVENRITFEAVYSAQKKQKKRTPATKSSVNDLVHKLFEPKKRRCSAWKWYAAFWSGTAARWIFPRRAVPKSCASSSIIDGFKFTLRG